MSWGIYQKHVAIIARSFARHHTVSVQHVGIVVAIPWSRVELHVAEAAKVSTDGIIVSIRIKAVRTSCL